MEDDILFHGWRILRQWLPRDLETRARQTRFIRHAGGHGDAELWLRLILMHVAGGLSLEQTTIRARELGWADVSSVALFKRLALAQAWLENLTQYLLAEQRCQLRDLSHPFTYRLRVIDATDITEPGSTGTDWRLHYSIRLPELVCDHYELTEGPAGERLGRFTFEPGELVLVDCGYNHRHGVAQTLEAGADVVVRWNPGGFPLESPSGKPFVALPRLRRLREGQVAEWPVQFRYEASVYPLRLCAVHKSRLAAEAARRRLLRKARHNHTQPDAQALEFSAYVLVLTSASASRLPLEAVLDLYRGRWQIELVFKRFKSLLEGGHVPKSNDASARAWMQAKLLSALLLERVLLEGRFFSPWGFPLRRGEPVAVGVRGSGLTATGAGSSA